MMTDFFSLWITYEYTSKQNVSRENIRRRAENVRNPRPRSVSFQPSDSQSIRVRLLTPVHVLSCHVTTPPPGTAQLQNTCCLKNIDHSLETQTFNRTREKPPGERNYPQDSINTSLLLVTMHCLKIPRTVNPRILQLLKHEGIGTRGGAETSLALFRRQQQPVPLPCWGAATLHLHRAFHDTKGLEVAPENSRWVYSDWHFHWLTIHVLIRIPWNQVLMTSCHI